MTAYQFHLKGQAWNMGHHAVPEVIKTATSMHCMTSQRSSGCNLTAAEA